MRWRYLLRPVGRVGFNAAFRAVVMGFAATSVLPGRVGELLRPYVLARTARLSASATFGTVVVERLLDLIAVLLLFGISVVMFESGRQALDSRLLDAVQVGLAWRALARSSCLWLHTWLPAIPVGSAG